MKKNYTRFLPLHLLLILLLNIFATADAQTGLRGMYIDNFDAILGNAVKEDSLLDYAQDSSFNYLALYDLSSFNLSNANTANMAAAFIKKARENYGIQYIGAVCESYPEFQNKIAPYNNNRSDDHEKFNVFNLEFEFWTSSSVNPGGYYCTQYLQPNGCSCDTSGAFQFYINNIHKIDSLAHQQGVVSETYLGWFNQGQASQIQQNVDRILLHAYRTNTSSLFSYSKTRLQYLASNNAMVDVAPIFSSEPAFMNSWLDNHSQLEAYDQYSADFDADNSSWKQYINILGYQWFDWGYMPKPVAGNFSPTITASGPLTFCQGGNVVLTATGGDSYNWSNGATTQSITVDATGSYTCYVTLNGNTASAGQKHIDVTNNPTATISGAAVVSGVTPLTANISAGSGTVTSIQWKLNNTNIGGANSTTYSAVVPGNYTVEVTNSNGCNSVSSPYNVTNTGIEELTADGTGVKVFPNPASNKVRVDFTAQKKGKGELTLLDINGKSVFRQSLSFYDGDNKIYFDASEFSNGIYFLTVHSEDKTGVCKLVIEH